MHISELADSLIQTEAELGQTEKLIWRLRVYPEHQRLALKKKI